MDLYVFELKSSYLHPIMKDVKVLSIILSFSTGRALFINVFRCRLWHRISTLTELTDVQQINRIKLKVSLTFKFTKAGGGSDRETDHTEV